MFREDPLDRLSQSLSCGPNKYSKYSHKSKFAVAVAYLYFGNWTRSSFPELSGKVGGRSRLPKFFPKSSGKVSQENREADFSFRFVPEITREYVVPEIQVIYCTVSAPFEHAVLLFGTVTVPGKSR